MPAWTKWAVAILIGLAVIVVGFRWAGWLLTAFFIVNCFVLMVVVLLQSGKAADLAGAFGGAGSQTAFGPRGAATVLSQATTWCAVMFMVCALAMVLRTDKAVEENGGSVLQSIQRPAKSTTPAPVTTPPANAPGTQQPANQAPANQAPANSNPQPKKP